MAVALGVASVVCCPRASKAHGREPVCLFEKGEAVATLTTSAGVAVTLFPSQVRIGDDVVSRCNGLPASHPVAIARHGRGFAIAFRDGTSYAATTKAGVSGAAFEKLGKGDLDAATAAALGDARKSLVATGARPKVLGRGVLGTEGSLVSEHVTALAVQRDRLFVGTFDHGVFALDPAGVAHAVDGAPLHVNALLATRAGLFIGAARGLFVVDDALRVAPVPLDIPNPHINGIAEARDGTVWLATSSGLVGVTPGSPSARVFGVREGLPSPFVYAVAETADGALWVGTAGGVARIASGRVRLFGTENGKLPHDWVTALLDDGRDGSVLVGTYNAGVVRLGKDGSSAAERAFGSAWVNPNGLLRLGLAASDAGAVVAATLGGGLVAREPRRVALPMLPDRDVTSAVAFAGALWVGTRGGIARIAE